MDCINLMSMQTVPGERAATFNTKRQCKRRARMQGKGDNQVQQHNTASFECVIRKRGSLETESGQEKLKKLAIEKADSFDRIETLTTTSEVEETSREWSQIYK